MGAARLQWAMIPSPTDSPGFPPHPTTLSVALKEWALVISALLEGRQTILLRKGGILEAANQFELEHGSFLLFPTYVHQDPRMVKAAYRAGLTSASGEPEAIAIRGFGRVARVFEVPSRQGLEALDNLHVWDAPLLDMRFNYRPEKPLYLVVVRAFRLTEAVTIRNTLEYAGCRSWVPLREEIKTIAASAVMASAAIESQIARIEETFAQA
jgi:hypothetical protein